MCETELFRIVYTRHNHTQKYVYQGTFIQHHIVIIQYILALVHLEYYLETHIYTLMLILLLLLNKSGT